MKINKPKIEQELAKQKRMSWKMKLILFLMVNLAILLAAFIGYYLFTQQNLENALNIQAEIELLNQEKARCNQLIAQGQGAFSEYEYCTQLVNTFK